MSDIVDMPTENLIDYQYGNTNKDYYDNKSQFNYYYDHRELNLKLYLNSEEIYNNIYQNITNFDKAVEILFKGSLRLIYKSYSKILDVVNNNREGFKKILGLPEDQEYTNTQIFNMIIGSFNLDDNPDITQPINDILSCIYPDDELDEQNKIQNEFDDDINWIISGSDDSLVNFDIGNINNIRINKYTNSDSFLFRVIPQLRKIVSSGNTSEVSLNPQLITYKFNVVFDLGLITNVLLFTSIYDNPEGTILDEDSFVEANIIKLQPKIYDLSRRIIVEIYDRIQDINGNYDKFNSKVSNLCYSVLKSDYNQNIINKMRYLLRSSLGSDVDIGKNSSFYKLFNNIDNRNKLIDILFTLETKYNWNNKYYIADLVNVLNWNYDGESSSLIAKKLAFILYKKAFSSFFSNTVLVQYPDLWKNKEDILKKSRVVYSREFDKKYNLGDLFINTEKISDYNLKDYYQELFRSIKKTSEFTAIPSNKLYNGEKESFLYSKALRFIDIYAVALMLYLSTVLEYVDVLTENKSLINEKYDSKLNYSVRSVISSTVMDIKSLLYQILSFSSENFCYENSFFNLKTLASKGLSKLGFMLAIVKENFFHNDNSYSIGNSELLKNIRKLIADKDHPKCNEAANNNLLNSFEKSFNRFINESLTYQLI